MRTRSIGVIADRVSQIVNTQQKSAVCARHSHQFVSTSIVDKAGRSCAAINVTGDLSGIVDTARKSGKAIRHLNRRERALRVEKAVLVPSATLRVITHNSAGVVDSEPNGAFAARHPYGSALAV